MKTLTYANGDAMPQLGLGTWKSKPGEVHDAVLEAIRAGYRHIDCAHIYGNEAEIGQALETAMAEGVQREELWITSKLWNASHHPENVRAALQTTLDNLRLDYLDLYLIHWPVAHQADVVFPRKPEDLVPLDELPIIDTWQALEACVDDGLARHIGVSNFSALKLRDLLGRARIKPALNQVELHPYMQQNDLVQYCRDNGVNVTAYSPLGSSDRPAADKPADEPVLLEDPTVARIADSHDASPAQVLIAWALHRGTAVIPKSVNPQRIRQNLAAADVSLTDDDMDAIAELDKHRRYVNGAFWALPGSDYTMANLWDE